MQAHSHRGQKQFQETSRVPAKGRRTSGLKISCTLAKGRRTPGLKMWPCMCVDTYNKLHFIRC